MEILFDVQNQIITRLDSNYIVEKSQEYLIAKFKFTDDWQNTQKFIIFETDNDPVRMEIINDECVIPSQVIIYPNFQFSIKGIGISNSNYVITTNLKNISILKTGFGNGVSPLPPVPTYEEKVNKAYVDIESIFDSSTGVITLTFTNNSGNKKIINIDLPTEQLVKDVRYDNSSNEIVITWENGQVSRIPLENLKGTEVVANNDQAVTSFLKTLSVDKINYAIPTKVSDLVNDSNFITNTSNSFDYNNLSNKPTIPTNTSQLNNDSGFITNGVNNLQNYYTKEEIDTTCLKQGDNVTFNAMNVNSIAQFFGDVNLSYGKVYVQNLLTTDEKSYLEANPELNGTEENLTSVTISGRNYKINSNGDSSTNPVISQSFTIPLTQGNTNIDNFKRELTAEEIAIIESKPEKLDFNLIINLDNEGVTLATLDSIYTITQKMTLDGMLNYDGDFLIDISGTGTADYDHAYSYVQISISKQIGDQTYMLRINSFTRAERQADGYTAGVVNPTLKTTEMTQEVGIDTTDGKLYTKASLTIDEVQALIDNAIGNVLTEEFSYMATLREIFTNIANAIRGKTSGIDTMTPEQMPTEINSIATIKNLLDSTKSTAYLFNNFKGETVDNLIKYNDTENVTDANHMFYNCSYLQTVPLLNTSNITSMNYMFSGCNILQTIPPLDTSNAQNLAYMFYLCENLQTIPPLDTSNATYMTYMFNNCYKLQKIDITVFVNNSARNASFAAKCYSLTTLIIRTMDVIPALNTSAFSKCYHFTGTTDATYNPDGLKDGRIYVPDDKVEELKLATNWSVYADIIVPLSTLVEE